jgi:hypothetical protein
MPRATPCGGYLRAHIRFLFVASLYIVRYTGVIELAGKDALATDGSWMVWYGRW